MGWQHYRGMFGIKFPGPGIFSEIFPQSFLSVLAWKTTEKTIENFPGSPKYDAKHWANMGCKKQGANHILDLFQGHKPSHVQNKTDLLGGFRIQCFTHNMIIIIPRSAKIQCWRSTNASNNLESFSLEKHVPTDFDTHKNSCNVIKKPNPGQKILFNEKKLRKFSNDRNKRWDGCNLAANMLLPLHDTAYAFIQA